MKKTYIIPYTEVIAVQQHSMIAQSVVVNASDENAGGVQLSKKDNDWDIWGNDVEY